MLNEKLVVNDRDEREHKVYLYEDYDVSAEEFETLICGYIKNNEIFFFKSGKRSPVKYIPDPVLKSVQRLAIEKFGRKITYTVYDGVKITKPGEEPMPLNKWGYMET